MKVIINCDDLGMSPRVNEDVFELMGQKRVTSATMMMNAPFLEDAAGQIGRHKDCSFGVHLNLTQFTPLTSHPGLRPLLNEAGEFSGILRSVPLGFRWTRDLRQGVFAEWSAQIERGLALGIPISHLDSHHHVHTQMGLLGVLKQVRERFGICRIRLRRNIGNLAKPIGMGRRTANQAWNLALRHYVQARTTDMFAAFSTFHDELCAGSVLPGTIELMCHPGSDRFAAETALLRGEWRESMSKQTLLASYHDLS
jgi:predicted glycoside hydrolase/deacetylase ChbG (UPF0249 family)